MSAALIVAIGVFLSVWLSLLALLRTGVAHRLALDEPNHRSLHTAPTPRVGGLVLIPLAVAGWMLISFELWPIAAMAAGLSLLSYADDRHNLPIMLRFGAHLVAAVLAVGLLLQPTASLLLFVSGALAIGWLTNLYNFMDGADGLAGGMAVAGFGAYAMIAWLVGDAALTMAALTMVSAAGGFLILNFPPARVFMGDAGSIPLGFLAGALGLAGYARGDWSLWFPLLAFAPFIVDATVTLLRRALRGERVWQAHREHAYQRMVRSGLGHRGMVLRWYGLMAMSSALAVLLWRFAPPAMQWVCSGLWLLGLSVVAVRIARGVR